MKYLLSYLLLFIFLLTINQLISKKVVNNNIPPFKCSYVCEIHGGGLLLFTIFLLLITVTIYNTYIYIYIYYNNSSKKVVKT